MANGGTHASFEAKPSTRDMLMEMEHCGRNVIATRAKLCLELVKLTAHTVSQNKSRRRARASVYSVAARKVGWVRSEKLIGIQRGRGIGAARLR